MTRTPSRLLIAALFSFAPLVGCSSTTGPTYDFALVQTENDAAVATDGSTVDAAEPEGDAAQPLTTNSWSWLDLAGSACSDGTQTGIGVNPGTDPDKLIFYFEGGGACGDYGTCYQTMTATPGPFGSTEFATRETTFTGSYMDRKLANNPFATWTYVYVPYCTGDIHSGTNVATYTNGTTTQMYHHVGHTNALNAIARIKATYPTLTTLVVSGASAGGYGALINYGDARASWPLPTKSYLIDDSGPPLEETTSSPVLMSWIKNWKLIDWIKTPCPECVNDFSLILANVSTRFASDRLALLESLQDKVISVFYLENGAQFQTSLLKMEMDHLDALPNFFYFFITGNTHTMIGDPANPTYTSNTTQLETFINNMVTDSAAWASTKPAAP